MLEIWESSRDSIQSSLGNWWKEFIDGVWKREVGLVAFPIESVTNRTLDDFIRYIIKFNHDLLGVLGVFFKVIRQSSWFFINTYRVISRVADWNRLQWYIERLIFEENRQKQKDLAINFFGFSDYPNVQVVILVNCHFILQAALFESVQLILVSLQIRKILAIEWRLSS